MICDENLEWIKQKKTYARLNYGLNGLWEILKENYPVQQNKLYLLLYGSDWNEYEWVNERFIQAMKEMNIYIEAAVSMNGEQNESFYYGIPYVSEEIFLKQIDENTRIIVGIPGWCAEMKTVVEKYGEYTDRLYPVADTAHPQYIEPDIFPAQENEIFVDVGTYDPRNSIDFSIWAKKGYKKIYAFEPDPNCYKQVINKIKDMPADFQNKIVLQNLGLSNTNGVLSFPEVYKESGVYEDCKMIQVNVVSLDTYLNGNPVTFIKMDVEGKELDVLSGMKETIQHHKTCIYHKHEDIYEIASYLLDLVPKYKFYLRHYNSNETECVLFCRI